MLFPLPFNLAEVNWAPNNMHQEIDLTDRNPGTSQCLTAQIKSPKEEHKFVLHQPSNKGVLAYNILQQSGASDWFLISNTSISSDLVDLIASVGVDQYESCLTWLQHRISTNALKTPTNIKHHTKPATLKAFFK